MGLHLPQDLADNLRQRILQYVRLEGTEQMLAFYDDTALGSAKAGVLFTDHRIVLFDKKDLTVVALAEATVISLVRDSYNHLKHELTATAAGAQIRKDLYLAPAQAAQVDQVLASYVRPGLTITPCGKVDTTRKVAVRSREGFVFSTTHTIEGRPIEEYLGVVSGEVVAGTNVVIDVVASISDVLGGRSGAYESELASAREAAFKRAEHAAIELGANAIVGIDVDYLVMGSSGTILMVSINGTAVRLADRAP